MASSWDWSRLLGGSDVWARSSRRMWVGRDSREEDFTERITMNKQRGEKAWDSGQDKPFGWSVKGWERGLQRDPWSLAIKDGRAEGCGRSFLRGGSQGPRRKTKFRLSDSRPVLAPQQIGRRSSVAVGMMGKPWRLLSRSMMWCGLPGHLILYPEPQNPRVVRDSEGQYYTHQGCCDSAPFWCCVGQCWVTPSPKSCCCCVCSRSVVSSSLWLHGLLSSTHGILQARMLEWVAMPSPRGYYHPRAWTQVSPIAGGFFYLLSHQESPQILLEASNCLPGN